MIPFSEGKFQIQAVADDGVSSTTVIRTVTVEHPPAALDEKSGDILPLAPRVRRVVRPGDTIDVSFQGAPGGQASFKFAKSDAEIPMEETPGRVGGVYRGAYLVKPGDRLDHDPITFFLKRKDKKKLSKKVDTEVIVQRRETPRMVELKEDSVLLTGPESDYGYNLFALEGVRFEVTGESGDFLRVQAADNATGWIRRSAALELPAGTQPSRSVSRNIRVSTTPASTIVEIPLQARHLHRVEQTVDPHVLKLTLYGVVADTDRIRYINPDSDVKEITWFQEDPTTVTFDIRTDQKNGWGYDVRYEGNTLVLEIRHKPVLTGKAPSLRGLKVAVDAGHSVQSFGTIGPWGNTEASVNLAAANVLKATLEKRGAEVVMIQDGTKELTLQDRVVAAWKARAQLYISLHCDAVPEGVDPREADGFSIHYYHPQSQRFAEIVHRNYAARSGMKDGGLWRSNLAVCRTPTMPSILMEMGFLIIPEHEERLTSVKHQQLVADTVTNSIYELIKGPR
jgi:N-acetylmuramoyl-L-alanine amidase